MSHNKDPHYAIRQYKRLPVNVAVFPEFAHCFAIVDNGFPIDLECKAPKATGMPPTGHPRRCQAAFSKVPLVQCKRWARLNEISCKRHKNLSNYKNLVGPNLQAMLTKAAETPAHERLSLLEEVDISRFTMAGILEQYEKLVLDPESKANSAQKIMVTKITRDALKEIREMTVAAARVAHLSHRTFDADQLKFIFNRMRDIMEKYVPADVLDMAIVDLQSIIVPPKQLGATTGDAADKAQQIREALAQIDKQTSSPFD